MFAHRREKSVVCPHCGESQNEPRGVISTFCRHCSSHFNPGITHKSSASLQFLRTPAVGTAKSRSTRIACYACGHVQSRRTSASSQPCRECGMMIQFGEIEITGHSTRAISTHGKLIVGKKGFLNSSLVRCASADIEGRVNGKIICSGQLRLAGSDNTRAQIRATSLLVDRGANIRLVYTTMIDSGLIRGRFEGDLICSGTLRVSKHGALLGNVTARSLIVDRGGICSGTIKVHSPIVEKSTRTRKASPVASENPEADESQPHLWLPGFASPA